MPNKKEMSGNFFKNQASLVLLMFKRRSIADLIKKNVEIIFGYPLYFISFLFPRNKKKWVIGNHIGFAGNSKYLFIYVQKEQVGKKCYWIASSRKEAKQIRSLGFTAFYKWSFKGLFHCLTAKTYIFSSHLTDINFWTSARTRSVNMWHGVGIKKIEFELSVGSGKKIYDEKNIISRIYLPQIFRKPNIFLTTSPLMREHFKRCFRITDKECFQCGYPRNDIFFWNKEKLTDFISKYENVHSQKLVEKLQTYNKSYLYMPTWRETRVDFITAAGFDFEKLNHILKGKNELFLLKLHPATNLDLNQLKGLTNIVIVDKNVDIYPVLPFTDVLITDYSSIYYDYLLLENHDIILFPFDYNDYILKSRDLAFDFDDYTPGKRVYTFDDLLTLINNGENLEFKERKAITDLFWSNKSADSSKLFFQHLEGTQS